MVAVSLKKKKLIGENSLRGFLHPVPVDAKKIIGRLRFDSDEVPG